MKPDTEQSGHASGSPDPQRDQGNPTSAPRPDFPPWGNGPDENWTPEEEEAFEKMGAIE